MAEYFSQESAVPNVDYGINTTGYTIHCVSDLIHKRAYEIFEKRGRLPNNELGDWLQAEREVKYHLGLELQLDPRRNRNPSDP